MLADMKRHQRRDCCCCVQRMPWCWTEEAAPWISQQLGLLVFHVACMILVIALYWRWQCLLTVSGNLLPHIITPLNVTTVAWCCRQTKDFLHPEECQQQHWKHQSGSGQRVSLLPDLAQEVPAVCLLLISAINIIRHCGVAVGQI